MYEQQVLMLRQKRTFVK